MIEPSEPIHFFTKASANIRLQSRSKHICSEGSILYIHGFNSSGFGAKAQILKAHFKDAVLSPSLPIVPKLAVDTLEQIIELMMECGKRPLLVGSSLGGYYAIYLAQKYDLKAVLINPSITPYETLASHVGDNTSFFDLSHHEWTQTHIESLRDFEVKTPKDARFLLLLQTGDEVLDYTKAVEKFPHAALVIEEGGSHGYDDFESKLSMIEAFGSRTQSL